MGISDEDKLIKNGLMFLYVRLNKSTRDTIESLEDLLQQGADINFRDGNDKDNTILHIAAQKDEKQIVQFLLNKGAILAYNLDNKTPWHLAKENNTVLSKEIVNIIAEYCKNLRPIELEPVPSKQKIESNQKDSIPQNICTKKTITYSKRAGTSGVSGQFYETKLLSLVFHRAIHDKDIEECYLAANIRDIGDFDDVCFRFKIKENNETKHVMCFMQAKHREHTDKARLTVASVTSPSGQFSYRKYYDSFLKIKQKFLTKSKTRDPMFEGEFKDINCYFILYTPLEENFAKKLSEEKSNQVCTKLHDFINTGKEDKKKSRNVFQFHYEKSDIVCLTDFMQKERIRSLGKVFLTFVLSNNTMDMMTNDLIQIYYPTLAQYVVNPINNDNLNSSRWKFREDFFNTDDVLLITLKETLYKEIVYKHTKKTTLSKADIKTKIKDIALNLSAQTITMLLGEVIIFDDKTHKLCLNIDKIPTKKFKSEDIRELNHDLQKINVTLKMVHDATDIIGKEKLKKLIFQLPYAFDNSDFPSNLKTEELLQERLDFISNKFYLLIEEKKKKIENDIKKQSIKEIIYPIIINVNNDNVGPQKILELSHLNSRGIGGTVGNLLQFDTQSQMFLFNTNEGSLKKNAKYMLGKIKKMTNNDDLTKYKINVQMNNFPRMSFNTNLNDIDDAEDYFSKLWFYTQQAQEEGVEHILKEEIKARHYNAGDHQNQFMFRVHSDAIFLRYHDEIQKWWKLQSEARYLTKTDTIFDEAKKDIIDSPVLTVLNVMFIRTLKQYEIEFDYDVIKSMNVDKMIESKKILNIVTDAVILSAAKIMQIIQFQTNTNNKKEKSNYTFINLDYVHMLPKNDHSKMMDELKDISEVMQKEGSKEKERLVIISETSIDEHLQNTLNNIFLIFSGKIIVITDKPLRVESEKANINEDYHEYKDERLNLNDLNSKCQKNILENFKVSYQGKEVTLSTVIEENSKYLIRPKILWSILNKYKLDIGQALNSRKYDEIKDYYIHRNLFRSGEEYVVNTFDDINEKIVLITSKPCMGKTILLTHLFLKTKKDNPQPWIVRINMSAHRNDFAEWPEKNIHITKVMRLLCKAALKKADEIKNLDFAEVTDETVEVMNSDNSQNISLELNCFIQFYNSGKVIFLFDGFETIYPQHTRQGIELFMALKRANKRMWITSNCYVIKILENELNIPAYKLDRLTMIQQESFLKRFWETNLKLEKLNHEQFNNINLFFDFISKTFNGKNDLSGERPMVPLLSIPLHIIYLTAVEYFKNEINNVSPRFLRETIKQEWGLNSFTAVDRYLRRPNEEESLELAGTPLHMYVAANYFEIQIKDKFDLHINKEEILNKSKVYLNTIMTYERFLKMNMKHICKIENIENKNIEKSQEQQRDSFFETHKKLALYAICKESDISKLLTDREIRDVKRIIKRIESGEIKTPLIDCVINGIPRFYNLLFAEYFIVEFAADLIKRVVSRNMENIQLESLWDFVVNGIILLSPPGVRNAFDYKLKYDPELVEIASNENCDKIIFDLIVKQNIKSEINGHDTETSLNIAINEGLVNVTNLLIKSARRYVNSDNLDGFLSMIKSGAFMLGSANSSWKEITDKVLRCISDVDGEKLLEILHSDQMVSRTLTNLCETTDIGNALHQKVKDDISEPIRKIADNLVTFSNNENLTTLVELLPYHLPDIVNSLFGK